MVYDGEAPPYPPHPDTSPVNIYGAVKLQFEKLVLTLKNGIVLRLSNIIGSPYVYKPAGSKFLEFVYDAFKSRQFIGLKLEEKRSFVYVYDVVEVILSLIKKLDPRKVDKTGIIKRQLFNVGGPHSLSRVDIASIMCGALQTEFIIYKLKDSKIKLDSSGSSKIDYKTGTDGNQCWVSKYAEYLY